AFNFTNGGGTYTGNSFSDYLLGLPQSYTELAVQDHGNWNNVSWAAYVQDNWRVNNRLTLNLGLRWDGVPHTYEANNRMGNFYPNLYNPADAPIFADAAGNNIAPNSPGLGTSPNPILAGTHVPFSTNINFSNVLVEDPGTQLSNGQPLVAPITVASITGLDKVHNQLPVSYQYSFGVQQALSSHTVLALQYVGNQNRHQN